MSNSWAKVRSFLDMMDIQDLNTSVPSSISSSSNSSSSNGGLQALSNDATRWDVAEKTTKKILSVIQPSEDSENRRKEIIEYLQTLLEDAFGIKVLAFGSVPLKMYLPDGDIDLTAITHYSYSQDLASDICKLLEDEEKNNSTVRVKDVFYVPAQVRVVKCTVGGICVDISFNQTAGLCSLYFLEQIDRFIGKDHLFKRSVILIKSWCYYESRILGGFHGLISTYALETMVLHVINLFHSSLHCPLSVLYKFLEYYSTFDWNTYCVGINGLVLISSLPEIIVQRPLECNELLLTDTYIRRTRDVILSSMGVVGPNNSSFPVKFLNILDPLRDDNNLGRSVGKGNFFRIKSALAYGFEKLGDFLMLPLENIKTGLENFFKDTLARNGKSRRADVIVPVLEYGSEISDENKGNDLLSGINYSLWFNDYVVMYPVSPNTSENPNFWNNQWIEMGHNSQFDQNCYYDFNKSPRSFDGVTSFTSKGGLVREKSRGTGTFIPHIHLRRNTELEPSEETHRNWRKHVNTHECQIRKEYEIGREDDRENSRVIPPQEMNPSTHNIENIESFSFSIEEFPVLPGSKPIPIKVNPLSGFCETIVVKEPSASLDGSVDFDSFKHSSPRSLLSEVGKQSDSDVSINLDLVPDPTMGITVMEDQESSKSEEKPVVTEQPLQLADDLEFPPLNRSPEPVITINKKEFPPLRSSLRSHKRPVWRKDSK